jgi:hypothetical protein
VAPLGPTISTPFEHMLWTSAGFTVCSSRHARRICGQHGGTPHLDTAFVGRVRLVVTRIDSSSVAVTGGYKTGT